MNNDSHLYCSECRFSQYVTYKGEKCLFCNKLETRVPTDSTNAETCDSFLKEFWANNLTTRKDYVRKMKKCGIPLFVEKVGVLNWVKLH